MMRNWAKPLGRCAFSYNAWSRFLVREIARRGWRFSVKTRQKGWDSLSILVQQRATGSCVQCRVFPSRSPSRLVRGRFDPSSSRVRPHAPWPHLPSCFQTASIAPYALRTAIAPALSVAFALPLGTHLALRLTSVAFGLALRLTPLRVPSPCAPPHRPASLGPPPPPPSPCRMFRAKPCALLDNLWCRTTIPN